VSSARAQGSFGFSLLGDRSQRKQLLTERWRIRALGAGLLSGRELPSDDLAKLMPVKEFIRLASRVTP